MIPGRWYKARLEGCTEDFVFKAGDITGGAVTIARTPDDGDLGIYRRNAIALREISSIEEIDEPRVFEDGEVIRVEEEPMDAYYVRVAGYWYLMDDYSYDDDFVRKYVNKTTDETGMSGEIHSSTLQQARTALGLE